MREPFIKGFTETDSPFLDKAIHIEPKTEEAQKFWEEIFTVKGYYWVNFCYAYPFGCWELRKVAEDCV